MSHFSKILESLMNDDETTAYRLFHEFVLESSRAIYEEVNLTEASYDGMIASMKAKYPDFQQEIADQLKWAKTTLKKDEKIVWYMKNVGNMLADQQAGKQVPDIKAIQNDLGHFFGFNIPAVDQYQFGKKSYDDIIGDLRSIEQDWSEKQSKNNLPPIEPQEGDYELMKFPDGSAWWWVDRAYCDREGKHGKHCGNIDGKSKPDQRILSLRKNGQVLLTFILEPNSNLGEMKAYNNQKPSERLHPQIMDLLLSDKVKGIEGGGYLADNNFSVFDLSDENLQVIQNKKPSLISDQIKVSPGQALQAPAWVRKMYMNEISKLSPGLQYLIDPNTGEYTNDPDAWDKAIQADPKLSLNVPGNLIDRYKDVILDVLKRYPNFLISRASRDIRRNFEILKEFVQLDYHNIMYVQPTTPGYAKLCKIAVSQAGKALSSVPKELRTPELCKIAVSKDGMALSSVPKELRTPELCKIAVSKDGMALGWVPKELPEYTKLCKIAVSQDGDAVYHVPKELPEYEKICKIAVNQNGTALGEVPKELRTPSLCKIAVSQNGYALGYVPEHPKQMRTLKICKIAVSKNSDALRFVPPELQDEVKRAVEQEKQQR